LVHFSLAWEQPDGGVTHVNATAPSVVSVWRQNPVQHWSPVSHEVPF
jgi:hypothetical protein